MRGMSEPWMFAFCAGDLLAPSRKSEGPPQSGRDIADASRRAVAAAASSRASSRESSGAASSADARSARASAPMATDEPLILCAIAARSGADVAAVRLQQGWKLGYEHGEDLTLEVGIAEGLFGEPCAIDRGRLPAWRLDRHLGCSFIGGGGWRRISHSVNDGFKILNHWFAPAARLPARQSGGEACAGLSAGLARNAHG